jgi:hypothetical protein
MDTNASISSSVQYVHMYVLTFRTTTSSMYHATTSNIIVQYIIVITAVKTACSSESIDMDINAR